MLITKQDHKPQPNWRNKHKSEQLKKIIVLKNHKDYEMNELFSNLKKKRNQKAPLLFLYFDSYYCYLIQY